MKYPVLLPNIFDYPFTYESNIKLKAGDYVKVPFGKKNIIGVIWDFFEEKNNKEFKLKSIIEKIQIEPLSKKTMNFLKWFSNYNLVPLGMCLKLHLINDENLKIKNDSDLLKYALSSKKESYQLSEEQDKAYKELSKNDSSFRVHLLQGTTGSGKTIVYFKAIEKIINIGLQALILLPEIGLTNEFEKKFKSYFGFEAAVWHSKVSPKKRKIIWNGLSAGKIKVVLGARSSLFLPFKKLGLITVDEEHDQSYKQDEGIIYNARDMAISRAKHENIPINLVTAVPSIETYENIKIKKYNYSRLLNRYKGANLPKHHVIDLYQNQLATKSSISLKTLEKVKGHLNKKDQVLFFINRRGFAPYVLCKKCLNVFTCPRCSINLVFHKNKKILLCHYCGYNSKLNRDCKKGNVCEFVFSGPGAGRTGKPANIYFQTYNLKPEVINQITNEDPFKFLENELNLRKRNNLPPYERFIALILSSSNEKKLDIDAVKLKNILSKSIDAKILGPVNAPIYRINQKFRNRLLIRAKKTSNVQKKLKDVLKDFQLSKGMKLSVDVDPISFN